jgi:predicted SPOUT superfamily RNA methylase MTH1
VIFTAQHRIPGQKRVENGITGTITHTSRDENRVTIKTKEREPRDVQIDTDEFSDLSLAYAVHVHKGQGLTTETSGILTGGWQTDREHTYVAVSRAREQTQIYLAREDLGQQGLDTDAIERLADRMRQSGAQEATITKRLAQDRTAEPEQTVEQPELQHSTEIAKQTAGSEADVERNTQAQAEHERHIDKVLSQQRQRLLDSEAPRDPGRERDTDRDPASEQPEKQPHRSTHTRTAGRSCERSSQH